MDIDGFGSIIVFGTFIVVAVLVAFYLEKLIEANLPAVA